MLNIHKKIAHFLFLSLSLALFTTVADAKCGLSFSKCNKDSDCCHGFYCDSDKTDRVCLEKTSKKSDDEAKKDSEEAARDLSAAALAVEPAAKQLKALPVGE
jgi:hypothetical protein